MDVNFLKAQDQRHLESVGAPIDLSSLRVALVHYWFVRRRGGERVLEALAEMFPQADIFLLFLDQTALTAPLRSHKVRSSFLQKIPGITRHYRKLLPLFPLALEQFRLADYDLVISSDSGPAKGVLTPVKACHFCYCHSPMRYVWDMYHGYREGGGMGAVSRMAFSLIAHYLRMWDLASASRVDHFVANSRNVASRIRSHYRRCARVIYPPVRVSANCAPKVIEDYYLVVSPLVDYKRVDLAIEVCSRLQLPLRVIGDGEEYRRLRRLAGPTVKFLGYLPDEAVWDNYARCRALLFPGEEDFGIVPVEAQSFGRPVIAYGRGGALESVAGISGEDFDPQSSTGVFFWEQSVNALTQAIQTFDKLESRFSPAVISAHVRRFDVSRFKTEMGAFIREKLTSSRTFGRSAVPTFDRHEP